MRSHLSTLFGWLVEHRRIASNPCVGVHKPDGGKARDRVLTDAEIVKFWKAAETEKLEPMLKLILLTGCRPSEVAGFRRSELSEDGSVWTIPSRRTKNKLEHMVFLPPLARELMPAESFGHYHASAIKARLDEAMGIDDWQIRDLRRTAATHMADDLGIAPHIVEAVLNHVSGSKAGVAGTYNRAAYKAEKKSALQRWEAHVIGLVEGRSASIVPMRMTSK
jgi:integrase